MSHYRRPDLSADELADARREARTRLRKKLRHGYVAWTDRKLRRPDGLYYCACKPGCKRGVYGYGQVSTACEPEYAPKAEGLLARMRGRNAGKKPRAA